MRRALVVWFQYELELADVSGLQALRTTRDLKLHFLAFLQSFETFHLDR